METNSYLFLKYLILSILKLKQNINNKKKLNFNVRVIAKILNKTNKLHNNNFNY